jgi:hypothetical protein
MTKAQQEELENRLEKIRERIVKLEKKGIYLRGLLEKAIELLEKSTYTECIEIMEKLECILTILECIIQALENLIRKKNTKKLTKENTQNNGKDKGRK